MGGPEVLQAEDAQAPGGERMDGRRPHRPHPDDDHVVVPDPLILRALPCVFVRAAGVQGSPPLLGTRAWRLARWRRSASKLSGVEPRLERLAHLRPVGVDDRVPGGVPVAALHHLCLAEDPLVAEAEPLGRPTRRRVECVALPLVAPVAEVVEDVAHDQELGLGRRPGLLQRGREMDVPDLDRSGVGRDAQEAEHARGPTPGRRPRIGVDHREEVRVVLGRHLADPGGVAVQVVERPVRQVGPADAVGVGPVGVEQLAGVAIAGRAAPTGSTTRSGSQHPGEVAAASRERGRRSADRSGSSAPADYRCPGGRELTLRHRISAVGALPGLDMDRFADRAELWPRCNWRVEPQAGTWRPKWCRRVSADVHIRLDVIGLAWDARTQQSRKFSCEDCERKLNAVVICTRQVAYVVLRQLRASR